MSIWTLLFLMQSLMRERIWGLKKAFISTKFPKECWQDWYVFVFPPNCLFKNHSWVYTLCLKPQYSKCGPWASNHGTGGSRMEMQTLRVKTGVAGSKRDLTRFMVLYAQVQIDNSPFRFPWAPTGAEHFKVNKLINDFQLVHFWFICWFSPLPYIPSYSPTVTILVKFLLMSRLSHLSRPSFTFKTLNGYAHHDRHV